MCRKDIPQRRVRRWSFSIQELVKDSAGRDHFLQFLEKEFSAENLKWVFVLSILAIVDNDYSDLDVYYYYYYYHSFERTACYNCMFANLQHHAVKDLCYCAVLCLVPKRAGMRLRLL